MATVGVKGLSKHVKSKYHTDGLKPTLQLDDISTKQITCQWLSCAMTVQMC